MATVRKRDFRTKILIALPVLLLALLVASGSVAGNAGARPKLRKCDIGANRPMLCGHIMVPAVRGKPEAGRQKIAFVVRSRGDWSRPSLGAFVYIEGGPGYAPSSPDSFKPLAAVMAPFLKRRELIAIDQRGTGRSNALFCKGLQRGTVSYQRGLKQCARQLGVRREGYTTANSAADIEAVRKALGLPKRKMILYGDSYGTYLGQSYAARYGKGMKGLILSSAYPGNDPFWRTLYPAAQRAVTRSCNRAPNCSGNALGRLNRMLRRAGTRSKLASNVLNYLVGDASSYAPGGYNHLNRVITEYLRGRGRELRQLVHPYGPDQGPADYFSVGMYAAVVCNDYPVPWKRSSPIPARRRQLNRAIADFRPSNWWAPIRKKTWAYDSASDISACLSWPKRSAGYQPPIPRGRKMPGRLDTLVLAGEFDSITSVREARKVNSRFPRGRLYIVPDRGHASELYFPFTSPATPRIRHFVRALDR
ncbi:MAG TPA: alpha/beta hydrolase [Solirubrobacterales bacterium]|nr:alpha/beta hydrolase [Solirubrobacterales bacterium]